MVARALAAGTRGGVGLPERSLPPSPPRRCRRARRICDRTRGVRCQRYAGRARRASTGIARHDGDPDRPISAGSASTHRQRRCSHRARIGGPRACNGRCTATTPLAARPLPPRRSFPPQPTARRPGSATPRLRPLSSAALALVSVLPVRLGRRRSWSCSCVPFCPVARSIAPPLRSS